LSQRQKKKKLTSTALHLDPADIKGIIRKIEELYTHKFNNFNITNQFPLKCPLLIKRSRKHH
jgi:hypothetical protein